MSTSRPWTARTRITTRPGTTTSTIRDFTNQQIVCAINETKGLSSVVGMAFVNLTTAEAVLSQFQDNQTFVRTMTKLNCFCPSQILFTKTSEHYERPLVTLVETSVSPSTDLITLDRRYWSDAAGLAYLGQFALSEDAEVLNLFMNKEKLALSCFSAAVKFVEIKYETSFSPKSLRICSQPAECTMVVDPKTAWSLELVQNLQQSKSKESLFGLLNETLTPMGYRMLRTNLLQPLTDKRTLLERQDAIQELVSNEDMFSGVRKTLKSFLDADKILSSLALVPTQDPMSYIEQSVNNIIMLKQLLSSVEPLYDVLIMAKSSLLVSVCKLCAPEKIRPARDLIDSSINDDITYQSRPLDLRNQRVYAVKAGVNGLLDISRQTFKEGSDDVYQLAEDLKKDHELELEVKFDNLRQFYFRISSSEVIERRLPAVFINVYKKRDYVECQTLGLMKQNQNIADAHSEVLKMSNATILDLVQKVRTLAGPLYKMSEAIALLDMIGSFAYLATTQDYVKPEFTSTLAIHQGRHPIREQLDSSKFVPNDAYAAHDSRFQVITGCNMSGKSTYIRSLALMTIMAQIGSFVPAQYASIPIVHELFARISADDNSEASVSTFALEMREMAFILRNIGENSLVIVDELGRGTSTRDGLAIALSISEALITSKAMVWFASHFRELAVILSERIGVVSMHFKVDMQSVNKMTMLYELASGNETQTHYGLAISKVVDLPVKVHEVAEHVSTTLTQNMARRNKSAASIARAQRRKVILGLLQQLRHIKDGSLQGEALFKWLRQLQSEFIGRMTSVDESESAKMSDVSEEQIDSSRTVTPSILGPFTSPIRADNHPVSVLSSQVASDNEDVSQEDARIGSFFRGETGVKSAFFNSQSLKQVDSSYSQFSELVASQ